MRRFAFPVLLLLAVMTLACSLPNTVAIVTATPSPTPTVTVTPTATPTPRPTFTPTATFTPTVVPQTAVDQADMALRNGDYQTAVRTYAVILSQPTNAVNPTLRAAAEFGAGAAALREGLFPEAVTRLSGFIQDYPNDVHAAQAYFLRGDGDLGASQWQAAIDDFQIYLKLRPGLLDSYAWERIGDAQLALGDNADSLTSYGAASRGSNRSLAPLLAIREKAAAAYLNAGDSVSAVAQYDAILQVAHNNSYKANIGYTAAQIVAKSGDLTNANRRYLDVMTRYPETDDGYRAMIALLNDGVSVDDYQHGQISFAAGDFSDAIQALYNYTSRTQLDAIDPNAFMLLGKAYQSVNSPDAALSSFQTIIEQYPTSPLFGAAWLAEGETLFKAGRLPEAIAKYKALSETHPMVIEGAEALWRAGYLYSTSGDTDSSLATFEILGQKYPGTDWAMDGLFRGGMAAYNQGKPDRAQRLFSILAATGSGNLQAAGALWLGRLYQINKQDDLARQAYRAASIADPGGYYSARAADLLAGHGPFVPPTHFDWAFNDTAHIAEAEQWLRTTFKISVPGPLWPLSSTLSNDPRMKRGDELWAVAAYDEARAEYAGLRDDNARDPLALYQLASYFYRIGLYQEAIATAQLIMDAGHVAPSQAPRYIAALAYPIAFNDLVLPIAQKEGVDPLLVFSLIRQESLYQAGATSSAAAQGLMQIIPTTGDYIAAKLNWPDYQTSDLYRPYINVAFGIDYLKEQLDTFNGNPYAALAAYNAGPNASQIWFKISNGDPDLFLQAIDIDQTQTYVRRIYEQYSDYAAIYGAR